MAQTNRQTDGHGDSMTELAQWGRFREKSQKLQKKYSAITKINQTKFKNSKHINYKKSKHVLKLCLIPLKKISETV